MTTRKLWMRLGFSIFIPAALLLLMRCADMAVRSPGKAAKNPAAEAAQAAPATGATADARAASVAPARDPRKIRRTGSLRLQVEDVRKSVATIETLAEAAGGFVGSSDVSAGRDQVSEGVIAIRVPAESFHATIAKIESLGIKVLQSKIIAEDVTAEYTDLEARIRNLKVEEAQVQEIMHRAGTIDDTLRVSRQLSEVRGQIEQLQGQINLLARQVELSTISVELRAELPSVDNQAEASGLGVTWRRSLREMKEGFSGYAETMLAFLLRLPVWLLWIATVALFVYGGIRLVLWVSRRLPESRPPSPPKAG